MLSIGVHPRSSAANLVFAFFSNLEGSRRQNQLDISFTLP
jgi:hypothetical protein